MRSGSRNILAICAAGGCRGAGTIGAMAALAILAIGCSLLGAAARIGLRGSAQAREAIDATAAAGDAIERLLLLDRQSLVTTGSGTLSRVGAITGEWRATALGSDLLGLEVTVRWNDTRPRVLTLHTAANR